MDFKEVKLLQIYKDALLPDHVLSVTCPGERMHHNPVDQKLQEGIQSDYEMGLEKAVFLLQDEVNRLKKENAELSIQQKNLTFDRTILTLEKIQLLQELVQTRNLLGGLITSKSWVFMELMLYLSSAILCRKQQHEDSKQFLHDILEHLSAKSGKKSSRTAMLFRYLILEKGNKIPSASPIVKQIQQASPIYIERPEISKIPYDSEYQEDETFHRIPDDVQTVAFFLPQFHTFPENDKWWGKGFTEWTNTKKAKPRFPGHYQPRIPHQDIGYYDLADVETMKRQARQAKAHGINAFCFYYYWFDGKQLMKKPMELLLSHPEIDISFCLCWANENWTRTWDGQQSSVLIQQNYSDENDVNLIASMKKYFDDPRYLRCQGKPVVMIYHAKILPDADKTFAAWRKWCKENGVGEIMILSCRTFIREQEFAMSPEADGEVEFPPHLVTGLQMLSPTDFQAYKQDGFYFNYQKIINDIFSGSTMADRAPAPVYRCSMLGWDNSCRRAEGYSIWQYFSLKTYHSWLLKNLAYTRKHFAPGKRFLFINAWNEWGEGTYLEPDARYGYASINTTTRALCNLPAIPEYHLLKPCSGKIDDPGKILIHLHVFYPELLGEFSGYLNQMPFQYDCIITTDSQKKSAEIKRRLKKQPLVRCSQCSIVVTPNCGRDVAPFFRTCGPLMEKYDYVGHFHTKKSPTVNWGDEWRHYLLDQLLGKEEYIRAIFRRFERDQHLGLFFPAPFPAMRDYMNWEANRDRCEMLLRKMKMHVELPEHPYFPVGQMFWAKVKAIQSLFAPGIVSLSDFEKENDQISDTLAHASERIWKYVAQGNGYTTLAGIFPPLIHTRERTDVPKTVRRLAIYVHYAADKFISEADLYMLRELKKSADILFVSNGELKRASVRKISPLVQKIIFCKNEGYDFGAWRDALLMKNLPGFMEKWRETLMQKRLARYDELILLNNSIIGPFCSFEKIFEKMSDPTLDFWGMSEFPETHNPRREESKALPKGVIPRHIQSYFLVFRKKVFTSEVFLNFWRGVQNETTLPNVVAHCETQLSNVLEKAGFKSDVYLRTASRLQDVDKITPEYNAIYCRPQDFLILGFPFLKKNICYYMTQPKINETVELISQISQYPMQYITITTKTR